MCKIQKMTRVRFHRVKFRVWTRLQTFRNAKQFLTSNNKRSQHQLKTGVLGSRVITVGSEIEDSRVILGDPCGILYRAKGKRKYGAKGKSPYRAQRKCLYKAHGKGPYIWYMCIYICIA